MPNRLHGLPRAFPDHVIKIFAAITLSGLSNDNLCILLTEVDSSGTGSEYDKRFRQLAQMGCCTISLPKIL